jgi:hypothetical protein
MARTSRARTTAPARGARSIDSFRQTRLPSSSVSRLRLGPCRRLSHTRTAATHYGAKSVILVFLAAALKSPVRPGLLLS